MTQPVPELVKSARETLGRAIGLRSPASAADLGRVLRMPGRDPGARVNSWLDGVASPSPAGVFALECVAAGMYPPGALDRASRTKTRLATAEARAQRKAERAAARIAERAAVAIEGPQAPAVVEMPPAPEPIVDTSAPTPETIAAARKAAYESVAAKAKEYAKAGRLNTLWFIAPRNDLDRQSPASVIAHAPYPVDDFVRTHHGDDACRGEANQNAPAPTPSAKRATPDERPADKQAHEEKLEAMRLQLREKVVALGLSPGWIYRQSQKFGMARISYLSQHLEAGVEPLLAEAQEIAGKSLGAV